VRAREQVGLLPPLGIILKVRPLSTHRLPPTKTLGLNLTRASRKAEAIADWHYADALATIFTGVAGFILSATLRLQPMKLIITWDSLAQLKPGESPALFFTHQMKGLDL
jgi:hypothetical protein